MEIDDFLQGLITGAPNLAVALLVLFWQYRLINRLIDHVLKEDVKQEQAAQHEEEQPSD